MAWSGSWVCMWLPWTPAIFKWPGDAIYIGLQVVEPLLQRSEKICSSSHSHTRSSRWLLWYSCSISRDYRLNRCLGCRFYRSHTATGLAIGPPSSVDVITPVLCSDASPVQLVLKTWLPRAWHRLWIIVHPMHRCLSWRHRFIRCFTCCFTWSPMAHRLVLHSRASDLPTTIGCTDARGIGSYGATGFSRTRPIQRFFEFFLRVLLCMAFLLHPWDLEMFT